MLRFQGEKGVLELFIEGDFSDTFEISPSVVENSAQFVVSVKNGKKVDFEEIRTIEFKVPIMEDFVLDAACYYAWAVANLVELAQQGNMGNSKIIKFSQKNSSQAISATLYKNLHLLSLSDYIPKEIEIPLYLLISNCLSVNITSAICVFKADEVFGVGITYR